MDSTSSQRLVNFEPFDEEPSEHAMVPRSWPCAYHFDVMKRENLMLQQLDREDASALAGESLTAVTLDRLRKLETLQELIRRFAVSGFTLEAKKISKISLDARDAALAFIRNLDAKAKLPKLAPDGEGGLVFFWQEQQNRIAVIVEGSRLHMVTNAASQDAQHIEDVFYGHEKIPDEIFEAIPRN